MSEGEGLDSASPEREGEKTTEAGPSDSPSTTEGDCMEEESEGGADSDCPACSKVLLRPPPVRWPPILLIVFPCILLLQICF